MLTLLAFSLFLFSFFPSQSTLSVSLGTPKSSMYVQTTIKFQTRWAVWNIDLYFFFTPWLDPGMCSYISCHSIHPPKLSVNFSTVLSWILHYIVSKSLEQIIFTWLLPSLLLFSILIWLINVYQLIDVLLVHCLWWNITQGFVEKNQTVGIPMLSCTQIGTKGIFFSWEISLRTGEGG